MTTRRTGSARGVGVIVLLLVAGNGSAAAQLRGTVTDAAGRKLAFATVVSRTGNGFLAVRTGVHGEFAFPGRPHRPGHTITVTSAGYRALSYTLQDGDSVLALALVRDDGGYPPGWAAGLPETVDVTILAADGRVIQPGRDSLVPGAAYRIRILMAAEAGCLRPGPSDVAVEPDTVIVVQGVFLRGGDECDAVKEAMPQIPFTAPSAGPVIRVVGRYRDAMLDFRSAR